MCCGSAFTHNDTLLEKTRRLEENYREVAVGSNVIMVGITSSFILVGDCHGDSYVILVSTLISEGQIDDVASGTGAGRKASSVQEFKPLL